MAIDLASSVEFSNPETNFFKDAAFLMDALLEMHTGLCPFERRLLTYYVLATHSLPNARLFPLAALRGPQGTGKSSAMRVAKLFAHSPVSFSARSFTVPAVREKLNEAHEGTAFIEEGDASWKYSRNFEGLLSDRYHRDSGQEGHRVPDGRGGYVTEECNYFGATVIHRRAPFADSALESRTVPIRFRRVGGKAFEPMGVKWEEEWADFEDVKAIQNISLTLPQVERPLEIEARIWDTYSPLIGIARLLEDSEFERDIMERMRTQSGILTEAQATAELDGIVVRALIQCTSDDHGLKFDRGVTLQEICSTVMENERNPVSSFQVGRILAELGFEKRKSHGVTRVYPTPARLVSACSELGIEDEAVDKLREPQG